MWQVNKDCNQKNKYFCSIILPDYESFVYDAIKDRYLFLQILNYVDKARYNILNIIS